MIQAAKKVSAVLMSIEVSSDSLIAGREISHVWKYTSKGDHLRILARVILESEDLADMVLFNRLIW